MSLRRSVSILTRDDTATEEGGDYVVDMSFASEEPYERWWGVEILECNEQAVRLGRLNDGAPLLFNHNWNDLRGTHEPGTVRCETAQVRGEARITSATQPGRDAIGLVKGKILTKASIGYEIHAVIEQTVSKSGEVVKERTLNGRMFDALLQRADKREPGDVAAFQRALDKKFGAFERAVDGPTIYRVTDWEPYENSLVTIPADNTVGIGRSHAAGADLSDAELDEPETKAASDTPAEPEVVQTTRQVLVTTQEQTMEVVALEARAQADQAAQTRITSIMALGDQFRRFGADSLAQDALRSGESVEGFTARLMKHISDNSQKWNPELGLGDKEKRSYSMFRALEASISGDWSKAGFEQECHGELVARAQAAGLPIKGGRSFFMPKDIASLHIARNLERSFKRMQQRDMIVATASAGGYAVGTDYHPEEFIDVLRAQTLMGRLGVRMISGLIGNWTCAKKTAGGTAYWLASESTAITESQPTLGQLSLSPKHVGGYTEISRQSLQQVSPDAEALVYQDLVDTITVDIDGKIINGSGASGQPTGILNTAGIGAVTGTSLAYAGVLEFQTDLANGNALADGCAYVTTPNVAALLAQRQRFASTDSPLWKGGILQGEVSGLPGYSTTQMPSATAMLGNFSDVIVAEWGTLEISTNPYANFPAGIIGVRGWATVDVGIRRAASFSVASSIT